VLQAARVAATSITYPGAPASVPAARRFVRSVLAGSPRVDDLESIAAELITNAIRHTPSGQVGGTFTVTVRHGSGWARLEVADQYAGQWQPWPLDDDCDSVAEYGRGLAIVAALADEIGQGAAAGDTQIVWAEVTW
jgi:serine/threonine-protein kinase RsbW